MHDLRRDHPNVYIEALYNFQTAKATFDGTKPHHNCPLPAEFIYFVEDRFGDDEDFDIKKFVQQSTMGKSGYVVRPRGHILAFNFVKSEM